MWHLLRFLQEACDLAIAGRHFLEFVGGNQILDTIVGPFDARCRDVQDALGSRFSVAENDIRGDRAAHCLVGKKTFRPWLFGQGIGERSRIEDGLRRAVCAHRIHRVGGIAEKCDAPLRPPVQRIAIDHRVLRDCLSIPDERLQIYVRHVEVCERRTVTYDFGLVQFTDTAGYRTTRLDSLFNFHGSPVWTSDFNNDPSEYTKFGNEARLSGNWSGTIWQVGYYYFDEDQNAHVNVFQNVSPFAAPRDSIARLMFDYASVKAKSNAYFGEVTVPLTEKLSATAEIRRTKDEKSRDGSQSTLNLAALNSSSGAVVNYTVSSLDGRTDSSRTNYNFVLNYQATPSSMLYAKYTTGYKAGGFDTVGQYGPEDLKSLEVGTKNQFLDGTLQFNAAAFYYDYSDQQISTLLTLPNGTNASATQNAASNKPYGAELELVAQVTGNDRLRFTTDYLDANFDVFDAAVTAFGGATLLADLSGNRAALHTGMDFFGKLLAHVPDFLRRS